MKNVIKVINTFIICLFTHNVSAASVDCLGSAFYCAFDVNATIEPGCFLSGTVNGGLIGNLDFGSFSVFSTSVAQASLVKNTGVTLQCTPGTSVTMSIDGGQNFNSGRRLKRSSGTQMIPYALYFDAANQVPINVNTPIPLTVANDFNVTIPIYARTQLTGSSLPGTYNDTLRITFSW